MKTKIKIPERVFFRIGDVAEILSVKTYVIRFWETEFPFLVPEKSDTGQRVYRRPQIEALALIQHLLHTEKYSIEGARRRLTELRKAGQLKAAMTTIVEGEDLQHDVPTEESPKELAKPALSIVQDLPSTNPGLKVADIRNKINALRTLIRDPGQLGLTVPELSSPDFDSEPVPAESKVLG